MPSGPSHGSHSSHSGGGFHGGGFSRSSGGSSFGGFRSSRPMRPIHMHFFGHTVIIGSGGVSKIFGLIMTVIVLAVICTFFGFAKNSAQEDAIYAANQVAVIEADAPEYKTLIDNATEDGGNGSVKYYKTTAEFRYVEQYDFNISRTGFYFYDEYNGRDYYFIVYTYKDENGVDRNGQTYAQFDENDIAKMKTQYRNGVKYGQIDIAFSYEEGDTDPYSMNISYTLNKNIEYKLYKQDIEYYSSSAKIMNIVFIVLIVFICLIVIGLIITIIKEAKKSKKEEEVKSAKEEAEIEKVKAETEAVQAETANKTRYCVYCGSKVPASKDRCPSCGSTKFTTNKKKFE